MASSFQNDSRIFAWMKMMSHANDLKAVNIEIYFWKKDESSQMDI